MSAPVIRIEDAHKIYKTGEVEVHALRGVSLASQEGRIRCGDGSVGLR
jgi:ABC-type histidine transport system ATPase subunit